MVRALHGSDEGERERLERETPTDRGFVRTLRKTHFKHSQAGPTGLHFDRFKPLTCLSPGLLWACN